MAHDATTQDREESTDGAPRLPVASLGRRIVGLLIDWWASWAVAFFAFGSNAWAPLGVFALESLLLLATTGTTFGQRLAGLAVVPDRPLTDGTQLQVGALGFKRAAVRTFLLCLVVPSVVWDTRGRGLHDRAAGTVIVSLR